MSATLTKIKKSNFILTNDNLIRIGFKKILKKTYKKYPNSKIIEELGISHGASRIDIAVINGTLQGYELKSDIDTLNRLPEQMQTYNSVFDKMTLVVGKNHLYKAIHIIPEWWGITIAKILHSKSSSVSFYNIRKAGKNPQQDKTLIASFLWKKEALNILEELDQAKGVRSKDRKTIYTRLAEVLDIKTLKELVRHHLCSRATWKSDVQHMLNDD